VGASCPADFRLITMIHSFAKLISKVLALRLAPRLDDLIAKNQNMFIQRAAQFKTTSSTSNRQQH
jgi:hypothetical protein